MTQAGGHRWQRVPPTEKRGRVHTSTVTVAVLGSQKQQDLTIREADLEWEHFRSGGPGGQNQNKVESGARVRHKPSGLVVESRSEKEQARNKAECLKRLRRQLVAFEQAQAKAATNTTRKDQIGSGMRGDKILTYRSQDDKVTDHRSGKKTRLSLVLKGNFDKLFPY